MILAGDIGGTKTNLAFFSREDDRLFLRRSGSYPNSEHGSLIEILQKFCGQGDERIASASFGIAGPVLDGRCEATNLAWIVESKEVSAHLGLESVGLINDLSATAFGTLHLLPNETKVLNEGKPESEGTIAVIAAGTGLGEGALVWDGQRYRSLPSEGGHTDFGPRDEVEVDLLRFIQEKFEHVSYERIVSGPGVLILYEFFRSRSDYPEPDWLREELKTGDPSAAIASAALARRDQAAELTLNLFVSLYGAEAGNLALKLLPKGGLYVGGGIAPKLLPLIEAGGFMQSFLAKGRFAYLMKEIPVRVILNDKTALTGAAHYSMVMEDES